ncbi:DUF805 domain-containing protein [Paludibacterium purpuratum]|nr:DUF805 domain-containing protein [Paludibacterium purpuratum]
MPIMRLFDVSGRMNRRSFWLYSSLNFVILLAVIRALNSLSASAFILLWLVPYTLFSIKIQVRRWHDLNRTGCMCFINCIPVVGSIVTLICLGFLAGSDGANDYGVKPYSFSVSE